MKRTTKLLYDKIEAIADKNIANQSVIAGEIRELVTEADSETLQFILEDVTTRLSDPGWGSYKSAVAGIKFVLEDVLKERKK
jgi:hypothetical protein